MKKNRIIYSSILFSLFLIICLFISQCKPDKTKKDTSERTPEIVILYNSTEISNNANGIVLSPAYNGIENNYTFTIQNTGNEELTLSDNPRVEVNGTNYTLKTDATSTIGADGSTSFTITLTAPSTNTYEGTISISSNDSDENPYTFSVTATSCPQYPLVISTNPVNDDQYVRRDTLITATFNKDMNQSTINSSTFLVNSGNVTGTITYDGATKTATFTPVSILLRNTTYTITITTGAQDGVNGNSMQSNYVWSFDSPTSSESSENCKDHIDNDDDGYPDCDDSDCSPLSICVGGMSGPGNFENCENGFDDDLDGSTDCSDSDCYNYFDGCSCYDYYDGFLCEFNCYNGIDDDSDGNIDCDDNDCDGIRPCP
ncbi:Ig-like domain-containing protein [Spirochaetota bacterium]